MEDNFYQDKQVPFSQLQTFATAVIRNSREAMLVLDEQSCIIEANDCFCNLMEQDHKDLNTASVFELKKLDWQPGRMETLLQDLIITEPELSDFELYAQLPEKGKRDLLVNATKIRVPGKTETIVLLYFKIVQESPEYKYSKLLNEVLAQAPAFICTLKGPNHVFELANEKYRELVGHREVIGKSVKEALPEVESQGFIDILNGVYQTGKPYFGNATSLDIRREGKLQKMVLDFMYQPTRNEDGEVDGIFVHAIDVTERVLNRIKLEESENELRNLIDTVPVIIWITDHKGNSTFLNKNWYLYTGQKEIEAEGTGWMTAVHPEDSIRVRESFQEAVRGQKFFNATYRLRTSGGGYRWVMDMGRPKLDSDGVFQGMIGSVVDVHEDRIKEELLKEKEHRIRSIVEEATVATAVYTGENMKIELANDAMLELWGKDREVIGKTLREALPELEGQPFHALLESVYTTGQTYWGKEDRADLIRNGQLENGYFNFTYKPLRNENGDVYGILNMALDVTEIVQSKALSKERESHFRQLANLMPEKVTNTDSRGKALYFNQNWLDFTGMSSAELKNYDWTNFIHPEEKEEFQKRWGRSLESGEDFEMEIRLLDREGDYLWHLSRAEAVKAQDGSIEMWIASNTEIQRLKEEEKRKEGFLKMVSHELKTPVTSIKGYIQLLLNIISTIDDPKLSSLPLKASLERIDHQIVRLTRLISEMLDLSRIEENKLELQRTPFSINELVDDTVQDIILTNTQHEIHVFHDFKCNVLADKDRIGQVLINFITNAIKYSPESQQVEITVEASGQDMVRVKVRDRGIGIDKKDQKKIFKRFYRIGGENEETYAGFGIGLYLANEIIQRHKGLIDVNSKKGKGSEFSFSLEII